MTGLIWSIALAAIGVFGIYLAGRRSAWGWAVGLGAQVLWLVYAVATAQWGFTLSAVAYGVVYGRNFLAWIRPTGRRRAEAETLEYEGIEVFAELHLTADPSRVATRREARQASRSAPRHWNGRISD